MNARKKAVLAQLGTRKNTPESRAAAYQAAIFERRFDLLDAESPRARQRRSRTVSRAAKPRRIHSLGDGSVVR